MNIRKLKKHVTGKLRAELSPKLSYHGLHHTLDVQRVCDQYIRRLKIAQRDAWLLRTASLIHDIGIIWTYSGHEEASLQYAESLLPAMGYSKEDLRAIRGMILATQIPQQPATLLEEILCDADLDYLGRADVLPISQSLYREFLAYGVVHDEESWDRLQVNFLNLHHYHTDFALKHRAPRKEAYLRSILKKWNWA
ncbi:MAG: hypothetical protein JPMHGGIA_02856 [Saprospiraceae bacterium]|jgi:uncharacterized protein|nr:hypothetical protein [Saprospiraceae bacterium]